MQVALILLLISQIFTTKFNQDHSKQICNDFVLIIEFFLSLYAFVINLLL